ncbi:MAG: rhodanese-like domain-containing protein [Verrucomicrobiota bacterium]
MANRTPSAQPRQWPSTPPARTPRPGKITHLQLDAFFPLQQSNAALIYDVRPAFFFRLGHIPGAVNWSINSFASQLTTREEEIRRATHDKRPVILYCTDLACHYSSNAAYRLSALGHSVAILDGGYAAWKAADLPTE